MVERNGLQPTKVSMKLKFVKSCYISYICTNKLKVLNKNVPDQLYSLSLSILLNGISV